MKLFKYISILIATLLISCEKEDQETFSCFDGVQNGTEIGVDCGGDCVACISCFDGIQNGNEVGIDCGGDCVDCLSSEKEILSITFEPAPDGLDPIININNADKIIHVKAGKIFPTFDFTNISFQVQLSEGAYIASIPSDFTSPRNLIVTAEDGSIAEYLFILTGAFGTYIKDNGNGSSEAGDAKAIYKNITTIEDNEGVVTRFSGIGALEPQNQWYGFEFRLANRTFQTSLVGTHDVTGAGSNFWYTYPSSSGSGWSNLSNPLEGEVIITQHDTQNKLISGYTSNITYSNIPSQSGVSYFPYVEFLNVRYN